MLANSCPACGTPAPDGARFCPACGSSLERNGDTAVIPPPPHESGRPPVAEYASERHLFGVTPATALLALGLGALGVGILLLALGTTVAGIVLAVAGAALLALFLESARRRRESRVAQAAARGIGAVRERAGYYALTFRTARGTQRELTRRRHAIMRLAEERRRLLLELGEAAYARDEARTSSVRGALERIDSDLTAHEREMARAAAEAHERVRRARLQVQPTETVRAAEPEEPPPRE